MSRKPKHDYRALIQEYEQLRARGESHRSIQATFESRGIHWRTFNNQRSALHKGPPQETPMSVDETPVEVLPGQLSIEDSDTVAEVHYGAVHDFARLPDGYAKTVQPMREYTDAEEWALNESMRLYGFIGAIVCDQYGRVLDGNQRQRIARLRELGAPFTITHVRDDAHAIEIATAANAVRRHYTQEQRQELAPRLRDQGFSYRAIADALGVGRSTVYRDILGELKIRPESEDHSAAVPNGTPDPTNHVRMTPTPETRGSPVPNGTPEDVTTEPPTGEATPEPVKRVRGRDRKSYPAQRPTGTKPQPSQGFDAQRIEERIKDLYMQWLGRCEDEAALSRADTFLNTLKGLAEGRAKIVLQGE